MGKTKIEWTADANGNPGFSFNPWGGCAAVSEGCRNCYAEEMANRFPKIHGTWGPNGRRVMRSESYWRQPLKWNAAAAEEGVRKRVFCASMADVFEELPPGHVDGSAMEIARQRLWETIRATPNLFWLLLTKRPENVAGIWGHAPWPENAWLGVSVENQEMMDKRGPILLDLKRRYNIPVAFLSLEPLLAPLILPKEYLALGKAGWCLVGGESGAKARLMKLSWALDLRWQCKENDVPYFFKQSSQNWINFKDFNSFPEGLKIREFPK